MRALAPAPPTCVSMRVSRLVGELTLPLELPLLVLLGPVLLQELPL